MRFREIYEMQEGRVDPAPGLVVPAYLQRKYLGPVFDVTELCKGQVVQPDTKIAFPFDAFVLYGKEQQSRTSLFVCVEVELEDGEHWDYQQDGFRLGARHVTVSMFIGVEHHRLTYCGRFSFVVDPNGKVVTGSVYFRTDYTEGSHGVTENEKYANYAIGIVLHTCSLFACRNISLREKQVPDKLQRKQERKHGRRYFKEYVLTITLPEKRAGRIGDSHPTPRTVPLHLCRGHFKTFTAEKPLLGKHTGQYWWQPHVRGDEKNGTIKKDYRIKEAKQPGHVDK